MALIIVFLFLTPIVLISFLKSRFMKKIIEKHGEEKVNKKVIKIGLFLVLAGLLLFLIGQTVGYTPYESYENGYYYADEVSILALIFIWNGLMPVMWWVGNKLKHKRGWTVNY